MSVDSVNHRIIMTAKKTLVESTLPIITSAEHARVGVTTHGYVRKVLENGVVVGFYNSVKSFLPNGELRSVSTCTEILPSTDLRHFVNPKFDPFLPHWQAS